MNTERELTNDELDAVSGSAGVANIPCTGGDLACALASAIVGAITSGGSGGGLVHERPHAN